MNKHIKNYLNSFQFKQKYWYTLIIDGLTFLFITLLFLGLVKILELKAYAISQGKSTEELKALLLAGSVETNKLFMANTRAFVFYFVFGVIIAIILAFMIYSFSRSIVWNKLLKQKFSWKKFRKWNGLAVLLTFFFFIYMVFYYVVKMLLPAPTTDFYFILNGIIGSIIVLSFMVFFFLVNYSFATEHKVWLSIGNTFHLIKLNWKRLWKMFVLALTTWLLLKVLLNYIHVWFKIIPQELLSTIISTTLSLLFLVWLRLYLLKTIHRREAT